MTKYARHDVIDATPNDKPKTQRVARATANSKRSVRSFSYGTRGRANVEMQPDWLSASLPVTGSRVLCFTWRGSSEEKSRLRMAIGAMRNGSYRYVLGQLEHPLYAFALLRTAHTLQERERGEDARDMITQVVHIGCHGELSSELELTVEAAANELQVRLHEGRPVDCEDAAQGGGEDEVPPGFE